MSRRCSIVVQVSELGSDLSLAPERTLAHAGWGKRDQRVLSFAEFVVERSELVSPSACTGAIVLDTTHARGGLLDTAALTPCTSPPKSTKKRVRPGDLVVSRLRPYLRQIAWVHPRALATAHGVPVVCSTEYFVFAARDGGGLGFLLSTLLSEQVQHAWQEAQEGGHHPRIAREIVLATPIPTRVMRARQKTEAAMSRTLRAYYAAALRFQNALRG